MSPGRSADFRAALAACPEGSVHPRGFFIYPAIAAEHVSAACRITGVQTEHKRRHKPPAAELCLNEREDL